MEEESEIRFQFQICSHNTTTQLYQDIQDLDNTDEDIMDIVCEALKDLSDECIGFLMECFNEDELVDMKKLHFKEIISTLSEFDSVKVKVSSISECEAVKEVMNYRDSDEEVFEESESLEGMTKMSVREVMLSSGELNSAVSHTLHITVLLFTFILVSN